MTADLDISDTMLPESDPRDEAVRTLDAMCRELVETVRKIETETNERMIGRLEERIFTMTDAIHAKQRDLYLNRGINVSISHTQDGLPVRVNRPRKLKMWGLP